MVVFDTCCYGEAKLSEGEFGELKVLNYHFVFGIYPTFLFLSTPLTNSNQLEWIYSLI